MTRCEANADSDHSKSEMYNSTITYHTDQQIDTIMATACVKNFLFQIAFTFQPNKLWWGSFCITPAVHKPGISLLILSKNKQPYEQIYDPELNVSYAAR